MHKLRFRYPGSAEAAGVSVDDLRVGPGERVLLRAGSGFGKSTLLQLVAGLREPNAGTITIGGRDIHALSGAARDRFRGERVGMIFQTFNLLHGFTAAENVMAALMFSSKPRAQHRAIARDLLAGLGIDHPDREVDRLSVGQQQRVAVARAVACDPLLVLADEPTASLDPEAGDTALDVIFEACRKSAACEQGAALLCTSHDPSIADKFDRVVDMASLATTGGAA